MTWIDSFRMAISAIGAHKLRSILTMVGIIAGVAAIIAVMTGVSVIQSQMEAELSVLSTRTFQIMKFPMGGFNNNRNLNFREIARWPPLTMEHVYAIRERAKSVDLVGAELWHYNTTVSYRDESTEANNMVCGGTPEYPDNNTHYVEFGRNLTEEDVVVGRKVVVLGYGIAQGDLPLYRPSRQDGQGRRPQVHGAGCLCRKEVGDGRPVRQLRSHADLSMDGDVRRAR